MKIGMLFPDYGSQYVGMAKELYDTSRIMQEYFEEASNCLAINFVKLCFASSDLELSIPSNAYTSLFLVSSALAAMLKDRGIEPSFVAGCGIGDFAAIRTAHGISLPDGLYFLSKYAHFYQEFFSSLQLSALRIKNISSAIIERECSVLSNEAQEVHISIWYAQDDCLISGDKDTVLMLKESIIKNYTGQQISEVSFKGGLHSSRMNSVVAQLLMYLEKIDFHDTSAEVVASVDVRLLNKGALIRDYIIEQIRQAIRWDDVINHLSAWDIIVEIGPGIFFKDNLAEKYPDKPYFTINDQRDIDLLADYVDKNTK